MQSITRFVARVVPKRPTLIRQINSVHGSAVNASRCICTCKIVHKYQKNVHNTSFSRYMETDSSLNEKESTNEESSSDVQSRSDQGSPQTNAYSSSDEEEKALYLEVSNLPFGLVEEDVKAFFEDAEFIEDPQVVRSARGFTTGCAILKVANPDICLSKNESDFDGRPIRVQVVSEERANALLGNSVLKIHNIPFEWSISDIYEFLYSQGVGKIMVLVVPPSPVFGSNCAGRAYVAFHDPETKIEAMKLLDGVVAGKRNLRVLDNSNLVEAYLDRARAKRRAEEMMDN